MKKYEDIKYGKLVFMKAKGFELQIGDVVSLNYGEQLDRYAIIQRCYTTSPEIPGIEPSNRVHLDIDDGCEFDSPYRLTLDAQAEYSIWRAE